MQSELIFSSEREGIEMFVQLTARKIKDNSIIIRVFYGNIDEAIIGNIIKIEEDDGQYTEPWEVIAVHGKPVLKEIRDRHTIYEDW